MGAQYLFTGRIPSAGSAQPETPLLLSGTSHPGQPLSHIHPVADPDDPLANLKVPCFGDQLTRVRFAGAKDLRVGCHTPRDLGLIISTQLNVQIGIAKEVS